MILKPKVVVVMIFLTFAFLLGLQNLRKVYQIANEAADQADANEGQIRRLSSDIEDLESRID
jgi:hypothetical protein